MTDVRHFILATVGHVDHGKSALVKALTGTDPDRLPEEKSRGITIDLGFAHLELPPAGPQNSSCLLGIVDVPGHEDFVKNMVGGVGSINLALLVVAADDGWMPQTEEHLQILIYLGVKRAVVAMTKIDLAENEEEAKAAIRAKLGGTPFADAPIVPTSVVSGRGLEALKLALAEVASGSPGPRDIGKPRLPVDRVFQLQGIGTIVTGTLTGGALSRGQSVVIEPSGKSARIRNIQSYNRNVEVAAPGARTALNLPTLVPGEDIRRGDVVTLAEYCGACEAADVLLEISPRASRSLKDGGRVWVHHGSSSVAATVVFFSSKRLGAGERALAKLRLEERAFFFVGDRFVVRDWAAQNTLAGGTVLDLENSGGAFRSEKRVRFLAQRAESAGDVRAYIFSQLQRDGAVRRPKLLRQSSFSEAEIGEWVSGLAAEQKVRAIGPFVADSALWTDLRKRAAEAIDACHHQQPERIGMPLSELRAIVGSDLPFDGLFEGLVSDLCANDFAHAGTLIRRANHKPALPAHLARAGANLRAALTRKPFEPPSRKELTPDPSSQLALRFLIETGEAVEISAELVMASESEKQAAGLICEYIRRHGPATASELRQAIGSSRRVIIPFLERLDRSGITERVDDRRILRGKR
jgi:selenocysteine-specific elongation factor